MEHTKVSRKILNRLPGYLNHLRGLPEDTIYVSAASIARAMGLGEVQVRKDLAKISDTGRRRTGRCREQLILDIEKYLDFANETGTVIVGAGKLGRALLDYDGFEEAGLNILAAFDQEPDREETAQGKPIYSMTRLASFCRHYDVRIGVVAVPAEYAQDVCDSLVECGVEAVWNFAPVRLRVPDYVVVKNEDLALSLTELRMQMKHKARQVNCN